MIRLILLILLLLLSLLTIVRAPTFHLWMVAIAVDEFPWVPALLTMALLALGYGTVKYQWAGTGIGLIALALFLSPVVRACYVAHTLPGLLRIPGKAPFNWTRMFTGLNAPKVPYQTYAYDSALTLDFYPARSAGGRRPCIVVIHGGSWSGGDARQLPELNWVLARQGYNVASINYRLAPRYQNPAPVEDVAGALAYLKQRPDVDTSRFVLLGRSAGAQIALLAAYTLNDPCIRSVISYYGPADMVWGWSIPSSPLIMDSRKVMSDYLGGPYEKVPAHYAASSPIEFVSPRSVPTLLIHGANDVLVAYEHSVRLSRKLNACGVPNFFLSLPWATHGCDFTLTGPSGQLATYSVEAFLQYTLQ